jgi:hypothetical protein
MRFAVPIALVVLLLTACGGSSAKSEQISFERATAATVAEGTARFTLSVTADLSGTKVTADESGSVSFKRRHGHLYKLVPGSGLPREVIVEGPYVYTNGNVQAALADPTVKPWTKLDTRRLTEAERARQPDELAHVLAPVYLAAGVSQPQRVGVADDGTTQFTGRVDPARLAPRVPADQRAAIAAAIRSDYAEGPFETSFWLDDQGRVRRVLVDYATDKGTRFTVDAAYTDFGVAVDRSLPPASSIQDISP